MKIKPILAIVGLLGMIASAGPQAARADATNDKKGSNDVVSGLVTKVDPKTNKVAVRSADGVNHEFEASKETLGDLKVGDRIEAKKRTDSK